MKQSARLPAAVAGGIAAAGIAALVMTSTPASAAMLTGTHAAASTHAVASSAHQTAHESASQLMTVWANGPGYTDLSAVEAALSHRNGPALAHDTTIAAAHPQPVDTADYVAMMRAYHAVGVALAHGDKAAVKADMATADDIAWVVVQNTFSAINRLPVSG